MDERKQDDTFRQITGAHPPPVRIPVECRIDGLDELDPVEERSGDDGDERRLGGNNALLPGSLLEYAGQRMTTSAVSRFPKAHSHL